MAKIIRVNSCNDCDRNDEYHCKMLSSGDDQCAVTGVRDDCPLEDAPDTKEGGVMALSQYIKKEK